MKKITLVVGLLIFSPIAKSQGFEGIVVEKYYVSDLADSTNAADNFSITPLKVGSVTYRVFLDMAPDYRFLSLFGNSNHDFSINTTTNFYNDPNNGTIFPQNNSVANTRKNTTMIDSYLSVGGVASGKMAVLKTEDTDGTIGNQHSILANNPGGDMGLPINGTNGQDGLLPGSPLTPNSLGFTTELDIFDQTAGGAFTTNSGVVAALGGTSGVTASNMILLGQFTTDGEFSFKLNVQLGTPTVGGSEIYVATDAITGETQDSSLMYTSVPPIDTSSLPENLKNPTTFSVYPNPTTDEFTIFVSNSLGNASDNYVLQDITGTTVLSSKLLKDVNNFARKVNVSTLPSGVYFLTVSLNNSVSTKKIVKQ
jgi:hypothetical protein